MFQQELSLRPKQSFIKVQIQTKNISDNLLQHKKLEHKGDAQIHFKN